MACNCPRTDSGAVRSAPLPATRALAPTHAIQNPRTNVNFSASIRKSECLCVGFRFGKRHMARASRSTRAERRDLSHIPRCVRQTPLFTCEHCSCEHFSNISPRLLSGPLKIPDFFSLLDSNQGTPLRDTVHCTCTDACFARVQKAKPAAAPT